MAKKHDYVELWVDGACRGNPGGHSGAGCILHFGEGGRIIQRSKYLGRCTSNEAEYQALRQGLLLAREHGVKNLKIYTDSELMHNQIHGLSRTTTPSLIQMQALIWDELDDLDSWQLVHVKRSLNRGADVLATKAATSESDSKDRIFDPERQTTLTRELDEEKLGLLPWPKTRPQGAECAFDPDSGGFFLETNEGERLLWLGKRIRRMSK